MTFDLDAAVVETDEPLRFTFHGEDFEMATLLSLPYATHVEFLSLSREDDRLRLLFAPDDWTRFMSTEPTTAQVRALIERWWHHQGITEGESPASVGSSPSTEAPSKQTSNATTA